MLEVKRATQLHRELTMEVVTKTKAGTTFRNRNPNSSPRSKHQWCIQLTHLIQWGGPLYGRHPHRQQHEVAYGALGPAGRTQDQSGGVEFSYLACKKKIFHDMNPFCSAASCISYLPVHWHPPFCAIIVELLQHYDWRWPGPEEAAIQE